jgi:shikimate kinase
VSVRPRRVLLLGMMGAGKTSVGSALSARTGWPYRDNDEIVASIAGQPTKELQRGHGVAALRAAESEALARVLSSEPPLIAGVAGGVVEVAADRDRLRDADGLVVYLHTPVEVLVGRVGDGAGRPWLQPDPAAALRALFDGREPHYRELADLVVDTTEGDAAAQADRVYAELSRR